MRIHTHANLHREGGYGWPQVAEPRSGADVHTYQISTMLYKLHYQEHKKQPRISQRPQHIST